MIFEPYPGNKLHPDLEAFYQNTSYKNRVMFLSGDRSIMEKLYANSKKLKAIQSILDTMKSEGVSATDQQYREAEVQNDTLVFKGNPKKTSIIFYQGALVDNKSYSIWANKLAKRSYEV